MLERWSEFRRRQRASLIASNHPRRDPGAADAASGPAPVDGETAQTAQTAQTARTAQAPGAAETAQTADAEPSRAAPARSHRNRPRRQRRRPPPLRADRQADQPPVALLHRLRRRPRCAHAIRPVALARPASTTADHPGHRLLPHPGPQPHRRVVHPPRDEAAAAPCCRCSSVWSPSSCCSASSSCPRSSPRRRALATRVPRAYLQQILDARWVQDLDQQLPASSRRSRPSSTSG